MWGVVPPVVVVEGPEEAFAHAVAEVGEAGWTVLPGFDGAGAGQGRIVRSGTIAGAADAGKALLAVLGGAGIVVHGLAPREVLDRLLDDLRHAGPVEHRRRLPQVRPSLDDDELAILRMLADGWRLGDVAAELGLSRRTADRRLAAARRALGVERTVEAVASARRHGLLR
jgi:DNA-binding CsgD family transcriptional regulator